DQLAHGVLAGNDDVVPGAARLQLRQQLVVGRVVRLLDRGARELLLEVLVRLRVVVLRPVVDHQLALEPTRRARAARHAPGCQERQPGHAERVAPADRSAGDVLHRSLDRVEPPFHAGRREDLQAVAVVTHPSSSHTFMPFPSDTGDGPDNTNGAVSSHWTITRSPGWRPSSAGSVFTRCSRTTTSTPLASSATSCSWSPR